MIKSNEYNWDIRNKDVTWMFIRNGKRLFIDNPQPDDFELDTIAHALAMIPRFCGQTKRFWSVANHSILVSSLCPPKYKLFGLFHDASEAYLTDLPRPIKYHPDVIKVYGPIEDKFMRAISIRFKFDMDEEACAAVKAADDIVGSTELRDFVDLPPSFSLPKNVLDLNLMNESMPWEAAKELFLGTYHALTKTR